MSLGKPLKVAILGCGRMGKQHADSAHRFGAEIYLVCDPNQDRARALAEAHSVPHVLTAPRQIDWTGLDAVFCCTPPFARGEAELAAAQAGVSLFLEKPVALRAEVAESILAAALRSGAITAVGYMNRYRPSVQRARQMVVESELLGLVCHWVASVYQVPWWSQRALSGGPINEQCTHFVDLIRYFGGEVAEVSTVSQGKPAHASGDIDVAVAAVCRMQSGSLATLYANCAAATKQIRFTLFTPSREICLEGWELQMRDESVVQEPYDAFAAEVATFLDAVRTGRREAIRSDLGDAIKTQRVIDCLIRSSQSGRWEQVMSTASPS